MSELGADWVRVTALWRDVEPSQGTYSWGRLDGHVKAATDAGLRPLLLLIGPAPEWAGGSQGDPQAFGAWAAAVADRYEGAAPAVEVWNEPNLDRFWWPHVSPEDYMAHLSAAYKAIKAVAPTVTVVTAGLAPASTVGTTSMSPIEYLQAMYDLGAADVSDAIGWHPYCYPALPGGTEDWSAWRQMDDARTIMIAHGDARKQLWLTEFGAPTGGEANKAVTEQDQATAIQKAIEYADLRYEYGPLFIYQLYDSPLEESSAEAHFGVFKTDGTPKESAIALGYVATG